MTSTPVELHCHTDRNCIGGDCRVCVWISFWITSSEVIVLHFTNWISLAHALFCCSFLLTVLIVKIRLALRMSYFLLATSTNYTSYGIAEVRAIVSLCWLYYCPHSHRVTKSMQASQQVSEFDLMRTRKM